MSTPIPARIATAVASYAAAVITANVLTARYGFVPVGFGEVATAGTYAAGLALLLRDVVQDAAGIRGSVLAIAAGAVGSWILASPTLAVASTAAFAVSEVADLAVYTPLRARGWTRAAVASGAIGAVVDTCLFVGLAFGIGAIAGALPGQLVGKVLWATLLPVLITEGVRRALPRHTIQS